MGTDELLERLGELVEKAERQAMAAKQRSSSKARFDALRSGLIEVRDDLKRLYLDAGGEDVWS